jgi:hypothetical protein
MRLIQVSFVALAGGLLAAGGCSRDSQQAAQQPEPAPDVTTDTNPITAESWVDDVRLSSAGSTMVDQDDRFTVGESFQLSMRIDDAPAGTQVTAYWYGPDNQPVAYETKSAAADGQRLTFTQDNTHFWKAGTYRAEIWVGDEKVEEESFEIVAG